MRIMTLALIALMGVTPMAFAKTPPPEVSTALPQPRLLGEASFKLLFFKIYDAELYTPSGRAYDGTAPFALSLTYATDISQQKLIDITLEEMNRIEGGTVDLPEIGQKLTACFANVSEGDRFTALAENADRVRFWFNGAEVCSFDHPNAARRFFDIWLGENTRAPDRSRSLRALQ